MVWNAVLVASFIFSIIIAVILSVWTVQKANKLFSVPVHEDEGSRIRKPAAGEVIAKSIIFFLFGPLVVGIMLALLWIDAGYPPDRSGFIFLSFSIAIFGLALFIRKKDKSLTTYSGMAVFVSLFLLLFSMMCLTRGADLKIKYRYNFQGAVSIVGAAVERIDDDGLNDDQAANGDDDQTIVLVEGSMDLAWNCGDFVCKNSSVFYCDFDNYNNLGESEVLANASGKVQYEIYNGYSPCYEQDFIDFDPDISVEESGNPYVFAHGMCTEDCPMRIDELYFGLNSNIYSDEEVNDFVKNVYWKRLDSAPEMVLATSRNLGIASAAGFFLAGCLYLAAQHAKSRAAGEKETELLPSNCGIQT